MAIWDELQSIAWPEAFMAYYANGTSERLLKGEGVCLTPPADDPEGIGGISAELPKKHPRNQKQCGRYVSFAELTALRTIDGVLLWKREDR